MLAIKGIDLKNNFKEICDKVYNGEIFIVSRPKNENIAIISEKELHELEKAKRNDEYVQKITRGFDQVYSGKGLERELIEE